LDTRAWHRSRGRRAISPIIATVLVIAVTLIASVAVGGFVFGTASQGANVALVQTVSVTIPVTVGFGSSIVACSPNNGNAFGGWIQLYNSGTASTTASFLVLNYGGATVSITPSGSCIVPPESSLYLLVISLPSTGKVGDPFTGYVTTSNGALVLFVGSFN
jgi:flagellin-like protein